MGRKIMTIETIDKVLLFILIAAVIAEWFRLYGLGIVLYLLASLLMRYVIQGMKNMHKQTGGEP